MLFTNLISTVMIVIGIFINNSLNSNFNMQLESFGTGISNQVSLFTNAPTELQAGFCENHVETLTAVYGNLMLFYFFVIFFTFGMISSVIQKIAILRVKDNVTPNISLMSLELSIALVGVLFILCFNASEVNTVSSDVCSQHMTLTATQISEVDKVYSLANTQTGELNFRYIMSMLIIQLCAISIIMLQRTQYLGELIMMLDQMKNELVRFFITFGLIIALFLLLGRMLGEELK